ncbi:hypothetical protein DFH09DRAFT_1076704 [Mycena vulgaris]|nr:hypothetical protein DFH09DRAFT_1076704 [Mycena vulgaris]
MHADHVCARRNDDILVLAAVKYLQDVATLEDLPYKLNTTYNVIMAHAGMPSPNCISNVHVVFEAIISTNAERLKSHPAVHHIDSVVRILLSFWEGLSDMPNVIMPPFTRGILHYIGSRESDEPLIVGLGGCNHMGVSSRISRGLAMGIHEGPEDFTSIWHLSAFYAEWMRVSRESPRMIPSGFDGWTAITIQNSAPPDVAPSIAALLHVSSGLDIHPTAYSLIEPGMPHALTHWQIVIEFLEECRVELLPYKAADTLHHLLQPTPTSRPECLNHFNAGLRAVFGGSRTGMAHFLRAQISSNSS